MTGVVNRSASSTRDHFVTIDALRGLAALAVCLSHLGGATLPHLSTIQTTLLTSWGWIGVQIFFVISGFIIPYVLYKSDTFDASNFLFRRFVRLWPPSAILLLLTIGQWAVASKLSASDAWSYSTPQILTNFTYSAGIAGYDWFNGVFWTLAIEAQYYFILALIFPLLRSAFAIATLFGLSIIGAFLPFEDTVALPNYGIYFCIGGACFLLRERMLSDVHFIYVLVILTGVVWIAWSALAAAAAIFAAITIAYGSIKWRPFVHLGTISYSLYLTHILVGTSGEFVLIRMFEFETATERLLAQVFILAATLIFAWLFWWAVERRFVEMSKSVSRAGGLKTDASQVAP